VNQFKAVSTKNSLKRPSFLNNNVIQVSAGLEFCMVLIDNGDVYSMGNNTHGQLGLGDTRKRNTPCIINRKHFNNEKVVQICCSQDHSLALTQSGRAYWWGMCRNYAQNDKDRSYNVPTEVDPSSLDNQTIVLLGSNNVSSFFVTQNDEIYSYTQANGKLYSSDAKLIDSYQVTKTMENLLSENEHIIQICPCFEQCVILTNHGKVYSFDSKDRRRNFLNKNGIISTANFKQINPDLFSNQKIKQISGIADTYAAVTQSGDLYIWGQMYDPQTPNSSRRYSFDPILIDSSKFQGQKVKMVSQNIKDTLVATESSDVFEFITNYSIVFNTPNEQKYEDAEVNKIDNSVFKNENIVSISTRQDHALVCTDSGALYAVGMNDHGQLGLGNLKMVRGFKRCEPGLFGS